MLPREPKVVRLALRPLRRRAWILPRVCRRLLGRVALVRRDRRPLDMAADAILGFSIVRDDLEMIRRSLQHHREAGIERFFIIDNGSRDGSLEFLLDQPDVHVFETRGGYSDSGGGTRWRQALLDRFGTGHWSIGFDADECLVWPGMETISLREFLGIQERAGAQALVATMIDMYPPGPLAEADITASERLLDTLPCYDPGPYTTSETAVFPGRLVTGGPRGRVFFGHDMRPNLVKLPALRWHRGMRLINSHRTNEVPLGTASVGLLHFKYHAGFTRQVELALARRSHFSNSVEYRYYKQALDRDGELVMHNEASARYRDTAQLVAHHLLRVSPEYAAFWRKRRAEAAA